MIDVVDVTEYVDAADNLAVSIEADLSKGTTISTSTIVFLNRYKLIAQSMQQVIDYVRDTKQNEQ